MVMPLQSNLMSDYNLNDDESLFKVTRYELNRENGRLFIDVYRSIAGSDDEECAAVPNLILKYASPELTGHGSNEEEALRDCLRLIKGKTLDEIFPDRHEDEDT